METSEINEMFQKAPSSVFQSDEPLVETENNFYIKSTQVLSAEEDVACPEDLSVRLADFGTCELFKIAKLMQD